MFSLHIARGCCITSTLKKYQGHMNVEWCNKFVVMKYLFKYVTKGSEMMLPHTPPSVTKPPGPSDGRGDIGSQVERALFTETLAERHVEELSPQVQSKELGLPSDAPDSPPAPSAAPLMDKSSTWCKQPRTQKDGAGKKRKARARGVQPLDGDGLW